MSGVAERYHHGDLRQALIGVAAELVRERGPDGFSLREAARAVGVSNTAAYRHFADRADLLAAVAAAGFTRLAADLAAADAAVPGDSPASARDAAVATARAYVGFALRDPATFRLVFGRHGAGQPARARGAGPDGRDPYQVLEGVVGRLAAAGLVAPARGAIAGTCLWTAVHGVASLAVDGAVVSRDAPDIDAITDAVVDTVLAGLGRDDRDAPAPDAGQAEVRDGQRGRRDR